MNFSGKGQVVNILGFVGHEVSVVTTQLCCLAQSSHKKVHMKECGCVAIKF